MCFVFFLNVWKVKRAVRRGSPQRTNSFGSDASQDEEPGLRDHEVPMSQRMWWGQGFAATARECGISCHEMS